MSATDNDRDRSGAEGFSVLASAPVRTADVGGWTDTWFARQGSVCNVAIDHRAEVRVDVRPTGPAGVQLDVQMTGERYRFDTRSTPGRHPMLESAAVALAPSCEVSIQVGDTIEGSGLGTSSAVLVALVAALTEARGGLVEPGAVAAAAHRFEIASGRQAGVQDHVAAAYGGISLISIDYPSARRQAVAVTGSTMDQLHRRLLTVWFGRAHVSSSMHDEVIERFSSGQSGSALDTIRAAAHVAADALRRGDVDAYGAALSDNHRALTELHPLLIGAESRELAEMAAEFGASGWKANGACGPGGSMVVVGADDRDRCEALREVIAAHPSWTCLDERVATEGVVARRVSIEHRAVADRTADAP